MTASLHILETSIGKPPKAAALASLCKAAGGTRRLQILRALARDSFGVLELCQIFSMRQPAMSHHLKVLAEAGLVTRRREGNSIFYRRAQRHPDGLDSLRLTLFHTVDQLGLLSAQTRRLESIQRERAATSQAFFATNAGKFAEQQELIATPTHYLEPMLQLISGLGLAADAAALELGPGTGWLLPQLARHAGQVTAVDSSTEMLDSARRYCDAQGLDCIRFVPGDNAVLHGYRHQFDLAVINMVLHHTPSPATVIADLAGSIKPGGALLVCDLDAHHQDWVRDACGDLWMGFASDDLEHWACQSGLVMQESTVLALRNGFQILIHLFKSPLLHDGTQL